MLERGRYLSRLVREINDWFLIRTAMRTEKLSLVLITFSPSDTDGNVPTRDHTDRTKGPNKIVLFVGLAYN